MKLLHFEKFYLKNLDFWSFWKKDKAQNTLYSFDNEVGNNI